jgi:hypothetical protein
MLLLVLDWPGRSEEFHWRLARRLRIEFEVAIHDVMARGNAHKLIVHGNQGCDWLIEDLLLASGSCLPSWSWATTYGCPLAPISRGVLLAPACQLTGQWGATGTYLGQPREWQRSANRE